MSSITKLRNYCRRHGFGAPRFEETLRNHIFWYCTVDLDQGLSFQARGIDKDPDVAKNKAASILLRMLKQSEKKQSSQARTSGKRV